MTLGPAQSPDRARSLGDARVSSASSRRSAVDVWRRPRPAGGRCAIESAGDVEQASCTGRGVGGGSSDGACRLGGDRGDVLGSAVRARARRWVRAAAARGRRFRGNRSRREGPLVAPTRTIARRAELRPGPQLEAASARSFPSDPMLRVSRESAMTLSVVANARNVIVGIASQLPVERYRASDGRARPRHDSVSARPRSDLAGNARPDDRPADFLRRVLLARAAARRRGIPDASSSSAIRGDSSQARSRLVKIQPRDRVLDRRRPGLAARRDQVLDAWARRAARLCGAAGRLR